MNSLKTILTAACTFLIASCFAQAASKTDCSQFKKGTFKYLDAEDSTAYIVMKDDTQVEYSKKNSFTIESSIKWTSDCSYIMTMTKISIPNFPFKPGDKMIVEINKIKDDIIYYTSTVKGQSWKGRFKKISD